MLAQRNADSGVESGPFEAAYSLRDSGDAEAADREALALTNAFSKKVENHTAAVALYFVYYNFGRIRQTLPRNPGDGSSARESPLVD